MEKFLSVSEMAEIHKISRQTLIYYDKIGLFKPVHIDDNGYRYYSPYQIPVLREICFLKFIGIKLEDIKNHIRNRNLNTAISLLKYHREFIDTEISNLLRIREFIEQRLNMYSDANNCKDELYRPIIEEFPQRKVVFLPFENEINRKELHLTHMKTWSILAKHGMLPSKGFGTIIMKDQVGKDNIFHGAGVYTSLPLPKCDIENVITLPEGKYACMYKYGMPYNTESLYNLIEWIRSNSYEIVGDIVDACILDTTFYEGDTNVDFCQLQIPVKKVTKL